MRELSGRKRALAWGLTGIYVLSAAGWCVNHGPLAADPDAPTTATSPTTTPPPPPSTPPPTTTPPSTPSTPPGRLTGPRYQILLRSIDNALRPVVRQINTARTLNQVAARRRWLAGTLNQQASRLESVRPPASVAQQHVDLRDALAHVADLLMSMEFHASDEKCGGAPQKVREVNDIVSNRGHSLVPAVVALRGHRLGVGSFLPRQPAPRNRRGTNGAVLYRSGSRGSGRLEIKNDSADDLAISVVTRNPSKPQAMIYVRANSRAVLRGTRGGYTVYWKTGTDWDGARRQFTSDCAFQKFDQRFDPFFHWTLTVFESPSSFGSSVSDVAPY